MSQRDVLHSEAAVLDRSAGGGLLGRMSHTWHHQQRHASGVGSILESEVAATDDAAEAKARIARQLHAHVENDTAFFAISCVARPEYLVRVGPDDFRDVQTDRCQVFSGERRGAPLMGSHVIWEQVDLSNGAVGFRALSNGNFLKVVPPKSDDWNAPWKTEVIAPLPGLAERFQIKGGKIYSELMHGYLQCSGGQLSEMVKGFPGETLYEETEVYHFNLTRVSRLELDDARRLRDASRHIEGVQTKQLGSFVALAKQSGAFSGHGGGGPASRSSHRGSKIALCVPMTSRGTDMSTVDQSPLWFNLFASFMESIDWQNNVHEFTFYLGLDRGDPLYDTGDAWSDLRRAFAKNTRRALTWLNFQNLTQRGILNQKLHLKLMHFEDTAGAPSQVVVGLVNQAYDDGHDYFFQVNDDTVIVSKDWVTSFIEVLKSNPVMPNLGITGPVDTNNDRILTHAFAHRTHVEIFGAFFPPAFKNWWSDDWISTVYGSLHTFRMSDVLITHNVQSQKTGAFNRYTIDESAQYNLRRELAKGFVKINKWLKPRKLPTLPLPSICGYSPLMGDIYPTMMKKALAL
jgi:hypothetical protein